MVFFKMGHSLPRFLYFHLFNTVDSKPLYQLTKPLPEAKWSFLRWVIPCLVFFIFIFSIQLTVNRSTNWSLHSNVNMKQVHFFGQHKYWWWISFSLRLLLSRTYTWVNKTKWISVKVLGRGGGQSVCLLLWRSKFESRWAPTIFPAKFVFGKNI